MEPVDLYRDARVRAMDLASAMSDQEASVPVPSCPGWTVKDVYAHLSGVADDALAGRMDGVATDPWTARQVEGRAGSTLDQVCDEWAGLAPRFEAAISGGAPPQLILDVWTHEQDVRGAVGRPGGRQAPQMPFILGFLTGHLASQWAGTGAPAIVVEGSSSRWVLGEGEPVAVLRSNDFELLRALVGRRSRRQFLALGWDGDGEPFVDQMHVFPMPEVDLVE